MSTGQAAVELLWIPLGAGTGGGPVRLSGRAFEAVSAAREHRARCGLFHSALVVGYDGGRFGIEMAPAWSGGPGDHGTVVQGPVGLRGLGRSRWFRYDVRCRRNGVIPDLAQARPPLDLPTDPARTHRLLDLVPQVPRYTWGRDEQHVGEMWNSNSLISWLLVASGHDVSDVRCPGRAPGWSAGLAASAAARP